MVHGRRGKNMSWKMYKEGCSMALIQPHSKIIYGENIIFENAYHKISQLSATVEKINVSVEVYKDESKEHVIDYLSFLFDSNDYAGADLIQIGYGLLRTLPEYGGAINVFEEGQPVRELLTI